MSCESCTRVNYCTTRTGRIQMPEKLFVNIREYVYLWKTVKACEGFSGRKQIF